VKTAIITGGSGDIGRACCEKFYESGYNIVFGYLNNEKSANDLCEKLGSEKCVCVKADISDINQAKKLIETAVETVNNLIGTGTTITIMGEEFKAVVHGDLDGDADISTKDLQNATKHVLAEEQLQAEYLDAGCIVGEEETKEMNLFDIYAIINYLETGSFTR